MTTMTETRDDRDKTSNGVFEKNHPVLGIHGKCTSKKKGLPQ